jgi:plastocyanin
VVAGTVLAAVAAVALPSVTAARSEGPREVVLVARGMQFVLAGSPSAVNPAIVLQPGERVRFILRNETPGIAHDFAVPALNVSIPLVAEGEQASVTFTVPKTAGRYRYLCRPHAAMMSGTLEIHVP